MMDAQGHLYLSEAPNEEDAERLRQAYRAGMLEDQRRIEDRMARLSGTALDRIAELRESVREQSER